MCVCACVTFVYDEIERPALYKNFLFFPLWSKTNVLLNILCTYLVKHTTLKLTVNVNPACIGI